MPFYTKPHHTSCGIDLHARTLSVCILTQAGAMLGHQPMQASPEALLRTMAPSRDAIVVAVACVLPWYWLADRCARAGMPCVRGHALSLTALHGGQATHAKLEAHQSAVLRRGGRLPHASVSPAARRAPRERLRRRMALTRQRAE